MATDNTTPRCERSPETALLVSMAFRYDHSFGLLKADDPKRESILRTMRQLWEEVAGVGFYQGAGTIAALRSKCEELEKRNEELELELQRSEARAADMIARNEKLRHQRSAYYTGSALQEAETKLRAAEDQVVVLREVIDDFFNYEGGKADPREDDYLMDRAVDAVTDTSALAAQRKREIQREALRDYGHHMQAIPELGVEGCDYDPEQGIPCTCGLAAILNPEGPDANTEGA